MQSSGITWDVLTADVDYWSGTTADPWQGVWANERARDLIDVDTGSERGGSGASIQGYYGIASEHVFVGQSDMGCYVRLSGVRASDYWRDFVCGGLRCSRCDVCVTARANRDLPELAYQIRYGGRLPARNRGKLPELSFYSTEGKGDTLYVGAPGTDRRGRLYDKGRESKGAYPVGTWRWEVQSRHGPADEVSSSLGRRNDVAPWIAAYVRGWFLDRGVPALFPAGEAPQRDTNYKEPTDDDRRVEYLRKSIRPMLEKLKGRYSVRQLRAILGLQYNPSVAWNKSSRTKGG